MKKIKTIYVEDEEFTRKYTHNNLSDFPEIEVRSMKTSQEFFKELETFKADIALIDINLTKSYSDIEDGFEITEKMRTEFPNIKFVFLTQDEEFINVVKAKQIGASAYINKLVDNPDELVKVIKTVYENDDIFYLKDRFKDRIVNKLLDTYAKRANPADFDLDEKHVKLLFHFLKGSTDNEIYFDLVCEKYDEKKIKNTLQAYKDDLRKGFKLEGSKQSKDYFVLEALKRRIILLSDLYEYE